jgi:hypothetical protein
MNILVVLSLDVVSIIWQKIHLMFKYVLGTDSNSCSLHTNLKYFIYFDILFETIG